MVMYRSSFLLALTMSISVLAVLLCSSVVFGDCTCRDGTNVFSENLNIETGTGLFRTANAACANAASMCREVSCDDDEECEQTPNCGSKDRLVTETINNFGQRFHCRVTCTGGTEQCVESNSGGGEGDPHLTGFDGSHYDFHGEHGKHYLLFGRSNGDSLVTRMRSSREISRKTLVEKTFFDEFGLQLRNCSHRISLSLVPDQETPGQWRSRIALNGQEIVRSGNLGCADVDIGVGRAVTVTTADTKYSFTPKLRHRKTTRRHIDVNVKLLRNPQKSDKYYGVLGFTMNKVIGNEIHPDLKVASRERIQLENSLRSRFEMDSLFSSYSEKSTGLQMQNTVRMVTEREHFEIPLVLSAEVKSI